MILLVALLLQHTVMLRDPVLPDSGTVQSVFVCNQTREISFVFSNDWANGKRGVVQTVTIAGKEVPGVGKRLTEIAHNRGIHSLLVRQCGPDSSNLLISAEMELSEAGSKREGLPKTHFFKFDGNGLIADKQK